MSLDKQMQAPPAEPPVPELDIAGQVAEMADRLKSEFLAITSHELRTPLNAILGSLSVIQNGLCDSREEELDFVRKAYISSQHLLSIIDNLLDLERIQSGKLHAILEPVGVRALFEAAKSRSCGLARQRGLTLTFDIACESDLQVRGDEARLQQILLNLEGPRDDRRGGQRHRCPAVATSEAFSGIRTSRRQQHPQVRGDGPGLIHFEAAHRTNGRDFDLV